MKFPSRGWPATRSDTHHLFHEPPQKVKNVLPPTSAFLLHTRILMVVCAISLVAGCDEKKPRFAHRPPADPLPPPPAAFAPSEPAVANVPFDPPPAEAPPAPAENAATEAVPAATLRKLDAKIVQALKLSRETPPVDQRTLRYPGIPIQDGERILVDIESTAPQELTAQIALLGGKVFPSPGAPNTVRAMIPLAQLGALGGRADVKSITPAALTVSNRIGLPPSPPPGAGKTGP
jgi:hypothetical protein